jgi:hypothetical protein
VCQVVAIFDILKGIESPRLSTISTIEIRNKVILAPKCNLNLILWTLV